MERTGALIERLLKEYQEKAGTDKLLVTVQLIAAELQQENLPATQSGKKISVIMPAYMKRDAPMEEITEILKYQPQPAAVQMVIQQKPQPVIEEKESPVQPKEMPKMKQPWQYDPVRDIPTLTHQQTEKAELNQMMGAKQESLNERLKTANIELGAVLQSSPVRDLKKAIGINDRYVFVNELFRGDEVMYERSIKTINTFTILAEAEYWIKRELKLKLAWHEDTEAVKHFDQLVKRRFS